MNIKYTRDDLFDMSAVDVYKLVLEGKYIKKFPERYWKQPDSVEKALECVNFLLFKILDIREDEILDVLNIKILKEYKLLGMLRACFEASPYKLINTLYPGRFHPWELNNAPKSVWNDETIGIAVRWLVEEKLKLTDDELKKQLSINFFRKNGLLGMLQSIDSQSPYKVIEIAYPGKFHPWEFNCVPNNYWDKETGAMAVRWLIEEKLKLEKDEDFSKITKHIFLKNGLYGMYQTCFKADLYDAINTAYPNRFKPWQFKQISHGYWHDIDNCKSAIRWLIQEKLQITDLNKINHATFKKNGLAWMLAVSFDNDYKKAIKITFPNGL